MGGERRPHIVVMGVAGCGKTTIARRVAELLGAEFLDADDLHSRANIEKMAAGTPLTEADREPWLAAVAERLAARDTRYVVACSALRRRHRELLRAGGEPVVFAHLHGPPEVIRARMAQRSGHFMLPGMLDSQLALLEPLEPDEPGIVLDIESPPEQLARAAADFSNDYRKAAP
ncbi:gluconokinase [Nocardia carnea]|uniref:gluconokinase n=1 Tax=Nocardia carnea TaxID=37328 RepID=UPI0024582344|nr:gluconokinase [Nocardia carnea]